MRRAFFEHLHSRDTVPAVPTTLTVNATSTTEQDLSAQVGNVLWFKATGGPISVRFGATGIADAVTTDRTIASGEVVKWEVVAGREYFKAISDGASRTLSYGVASPLNI